MTVQQLSVKSLHPKSFIPSGSNREQIEDDINEREELRFFEED